MKRRHWRRALIPWGLLLALAAPVQADDDLEHLARELMTLRDRVEGLQDRLDALETERKSRLSALAQQRAEAEANLRRARLQAEELEQNLTALRRQIERDRAEDRTLVPAVKEALARQRARVRAGLPFKVKQRLGVLDEIEGNLDAGAITSAQAAARLWAFIEDEARLARESGLYREPVTVAGGEVLADVARLGLVALYYRTPEGELGHLVRDGDAWRTRPLTEEGDREQVAELFSALEKRVRTGFFTLPNALEVTR